MTTIHLVSSTTHAKYNNNLIYNAHSVEEISNWRRGGDERRQNVQRGAIKPRPLASVSRKRAKYFTR